MSAPEHDERLDTAGAWVLGAVPEDEAAVYAAHLEGCAVCRDEVARLRFAADVLPLAAPVVEASPELTGRIMAVVNREAELLAAAGSGADRPARSRRLPALRLLRLPRLSLGRPLVATACACVLLAVGAVLGVALKGDDRPATTVRALNVDSGKVAGASAELTQTGDEGALRVVNLRPPPRGRVYQVWLQRRGQSPQPDAVFTVDRHGTGSVAVRGRLAGVHRILVTDEPEGGASVPTRQPILVANLT